MLKKELDYLYSFHDHDKLSASPNLDAIMRLIGEMASIIYKQKGLKQPLSADVVNAQAEKIWDGVKEGYGSDLPKLDYDTPDYNMMASLKTDVWQFSAAKNWQERKAMTEALTGPDGKLRSLSEFKKAVRPIIDDQVKWLATEYRTAIASSQMAAKWMDIQKNKEILPLLQFNAVMDNHTTELCRSLNDVIKPVDDAFWDSYYPPNHFNCRSDVRQIAKGTVTPDDQISYPELPKMFLTNVAKKGLVYPPGSSYCVGFPENAKKVALRLFYNEITNWGKENLIGKNVEMERIGKVGFNSRGIEKFINQNHDSYHAKNISLYKINDIMENASYIKTVRDDNPNKPLLYSFFKIRINGKDAWLVIKENLQRGEKYLWSVVDKLKNAS